MRDVVIPREAVTPQAAATTRATEREIAIRGFNNEKFGSTYGQGLVSLLRVLVCL